MRLLAPFVRRNSKCPESLWGTVLPTSYPPLSYRCPVGLGFFPPPFASHQLADTDWSMASSYGLLSVPLAAVSVDGPSADFDDYADEWNGAPKGSDAPIHFTEA